MNSRVGHVAIRLRLPAELAEQAPALRTRVEREVMVEVLDELERRVHAHFGADVLIYIRRLPVTWRLDGAALADPGLSLRLGAELADAVIDEIDGLDPPTRLRPAGEGAVIFTDAHHAAAAFLADDAAGLGDRWFHRSRAGAASVWREVIGGGEREVREVLAWLARMDAVEPALGRCPGIIPELLALVPRAGWPAAAAAARDRVERAGLGWPAGATGPAGPRPAVPPTATDRIDVARVASPADDRAGAGATEVTGPSATRSTPASPASEAGEILDAAGAPEPDGGRPFTATGAAGLFYLIGRVLEIDLAERLWGAGLPEADVLAHVAAALLGDATDPAWRWFSGVLDRAPDVSPIDAATEGEIREQVQHGLGVRMVRFGIETTPAELERELTQIAAAFPPVLPAPPALGRVCSHAAAAIARITAARLGVPASAVLIRGLVARPGRLWLDVDRLVVELPAAAVELDHRRAGLDQDPGHVPWLERRLVFEFTGALTV